MWPVVNNRKQTVSADWPLTEVSFMDSMKAINVNKDYNPHLLFASKSSLNGASMKRGILEDKYKGSYHTGATRDLLTLQLDYFLTRP